MVQKVTKHEKRGVQETVSLGMKSKTGDTFLYGLPPSCVVPTIKPPATRPSFSVGVTLVSIIQTLPFRFDKWRRGDGPVWVGSSFEVLVPTLLKDTLFF